MIGILIFLVVCSIICYGYSFAYLQKHYYEIADEQYYKDMVISLVMGLCGPIGIIVIYLDIKTFKYGLKFW